MLGRKFDCEGARVALQLIIDLMYCYRTVHKQGFLCICTFQSAEKDIVMMTSGFFHPWNCAPTHIPLSAHTAKMATIPFTLS